MRSTYLSNNSFFFPDRYTPSFRGKVFRSFTDNYSFGSSSTDSTQPQVANHSGTPNRLFFLTENEQQQLDKGVRNRIRPCTDFSSSSTRSPANLDTLPQHITTPELHSLADLAT
eukprot:scpid111570/ scgid16204/ 